METNMETYMGFNAGAFVWEPLWEPVWDVSPHSYPHVRAGRGVFAIEALTSLARVHHCIHLRF